MDAVLGEVHEKRIRVTRSQKKRLVELVYADQSLYTGRTEGQTDKRTVKMKWEALADEMNSMGPKKDATGWKESWMDLKSRVRLKLKKNSAALTYNDKIQFQALSPEEEIVAEIIGHSALDGISKVLNSEFPAEAPLQSSTDNGFDDSEEEENETVTAEDGESTELTETEKDPLQHGRLDESPPKKRRRGGGGEGDHYLTPEILMTEDEAQEAVAVSAAGDTLASAIDRVGAAIAGAVERAGHTIAGAFERESGATTSAVERAAVVIAATLTNLAATFNRKS